MHLSHLDWKAILNFIDITISQLSVDTWITQSLVPLVSRSLSKRKMRVLCKERTSVPTAKRTKERVQRDAMFACVQYVWVLTNVPSTVSIATSRILYDVFFATWWEKKVRKIAPCKEVDETIRFNIPPRDSQIYDSSVIVVHHEYVAEPEKDNLLQGHGHSEKPRDVPERARDVPEKPLAPVDTQMANAALVFSITPASRTNSSLSNTESSVVEQEQQPRYHHHVTYSSVVPVDIDTSMMPDVPQPPPPPIEYYKQYPKVPRLNFEQEIKDKLAVVRRAVAPPSENTLDVHFNNIDPTEKDAVTSAGDVTKRKSPAEEAKKCRVQ